MGDARLRTALAERLCAQRLELEAAARRRIGSVSPSDSPGADELDQAVSAAISYGIEAVAGGAGQAPPLPGILLTRARLAAREGVQLQTLVRRYLAGFAAFGDFLLEQAQHRELSTGATLRQLFDELACLVDRAVATVGSEYARAADGRPRSPSERRADLVTRLLAGELLEPTELAYDFAATHLGLIAVGEAARATVDRLAARHRFRCLLIEPDAGTVWAWLGSRRGLDPDAVLACLGPDTPRDLALALGEPAPLLAGWRLTHHQARATIPFAQSNPAIRTRYRTVALLASAQRDNLLVDSLHRLYIEPLEERDRAGAALCETLRTYFAASLNISSTAAKLRVDRRTVAKRLRSAEQCLGQPLSACATDLQIALQIAALPTSGGDSSRDPQNVASHVVNSVHIGHAEEPALSEPVPRPP